MSKDKLKPCPFCGTNPIGPDEGQEYWWVECEECDICMGFKSKIEVVRRWNKRAEN